MTEELAMELMRDSAQAARDLAYSGVLSRHMAGFFEGKIAGIACVVYTEEVQRLQEELDKELQALPKCD